MRAPETLAETPVYEDGSFHACHRVEAEGPSYLGSLLTPSRRPVPGRADLAYRASEKLGSLVARQSRARKTGAPASGSYAFGFTDAYGRSTCWK